MTLAPETPLPVDDARLGSVETFDSLDPGNGQVLGTYPVQSAEEVEQAVARGREAAVWWAAQGWQGRRTHLRAWKGVLARRMHELAELVHRENGKPHPDAILEITLAIDHIEWAAKHAQKVLGERRVPAGLMAANQAASVEYQPFGVIGVIGPWNYPVFTPMGSLAYALAAGNAVVFKPSEFTPGVGRWLEHAVADGGAGASRRPAGRDRARSDRGRAVPVRGRQDRVHWFGRDRQKGDGGVRREPDTGAHGMRRQGRDDRRR